MEIVGNIALKAIIFTIMVAGLFGLIVPVVPGLTIIWVAALVYALVTGFTWVTGILFGFITGLMLVGNLIDNIFMGAGAGTTGANWLSIAVAMVAGIIGSLLWPPFGGLLAALVGIFIVEFIRKRELRQAWDSARSMAVGCGWAVVVRFLIGGVMLLIWLVWALFI